jgi:hypothetical protein
VIFTQALPLCLTAQRHGVPLIDSAVTRDLADRAVVSLPMVGAVRQVLIPENIFMSITFIGE